MLIADLSSANGYPVNHAALTAAGITGEMVKATESTDYVNPYFGLVYREAKAAGQRAGAYHFDHWNEQLDPQLEWFAGHYGPADVDLAPWWDLEDYQAPDGSWLRLGVAQAWADVIARCKVMLWCLRSHYGYGLIYCTRDTAGHLINGGFTPADLVVAQGATGPLYRAAIMQFPPAAIPGVSGLTDWSATT